MSTLTKYIKDAARLSRKDVSIMALVFMVSTVTSIVYLYRNPIYVDQLQPTMFVLSVLIFILLGLNVSYIAYKLLSYPEHLAFLHMEVGGTLQLKKLVVTLIALNFLAFANFSFLIIGYFFEEEFAKVAAVSMSVGTWPLFFLILMGIDSSIFESHPVEVEQTFGTPVAEPCGPLIIPNLSNREAAGC